MVDALLAQVGPDGYLAVQAYLDRVDHPEVAGVRDTLAARVKRPVTFGWGPRFLHSTGQFHKGGPAVGVFLQIIAAEPDDLAIPDRPFTFGELIQAQAAGDAAVLAATRTAGAQPHAQRSRRRHAARACSPPSGRRRCPR